MMRLDAVQRWPVPKKAPSREQATARSRSASSSTTIGFLPPISICTRAWRATAAAATLAPTPCEPVKETPSTPGCLAMASPTRPPPRTRLNTPLGAPASWMMAARAWATAGVGLAGFSTTVLPKARAGADFQAGMAMGKFQGAISPNTPTGSRRVVTSMPGRVESRAWPWRRSASPAKYLKMRPALATSPMASGRVLPSSRASRVPRASRRCRISSPTLSSRSDRTSGLAPDQDGKAWRAASTAASTSAAPPSG